MKKIRVFLLFGGLFLMLGGYVAWCTRTFYLRANVPEQDFVKVPEEARGVLIAEIRRLDLSRPEEFALPRLTRLLMKPYDCEPPTIRIVGPQEGRLFFIRKPGWRHFSLDSSSGSWEPAAENRKSSRELEIDVVY